MVTNTVNGIVQAIRNGRLLEPSQIEELTRTLQARFPDPQALVKELLQRGWLTSYQANQILQGNARELVLGPYLVLERLGEGANGQVFKARHQALNRTIALKVLRKDLLADSDAVGRFYREIEVTSRVSHPHIVHAYDAGPIGSAHCLAMEYVEGCDLDRLVREKGPLAVPQACDYIRQAALGLQHAHEKGLVHRDIKPSNLLVARTQTSKSRVQGLRSPLPDSAAGLWTLNFGVVKLLDLGLARLHEYSQGSKTGNLTKLAGNSVMMGTPDYLSPEQALDFHTADIRSDIYSLGCTFFYLLTGQPPYPAKTLPEKLMKHQQAEVPSITDARKDAPAALGSILEKMLAKRPKDRYQTPGEVAADLATFLSTLNGAAKPGVGLSGVLPAVARKRGSSLRIRKENAASAAAPQVERSAQPTPLKVPRPKTRFDSPSVRRHYRLWTIGGAAALLAGLAVFGFLLFLSQPTPETHVGSQTRATSTGPETKPVTTELMGRLRPFLIVQCGKGKDGDGQVQLRRPGFDFKLLQGSNFDGWPGEALRTHCWAHDKEVRFEVVVPPGTPGVLRLWLVDGDNLGRKERLVVQGKTIGEYAKFGNLGQEVSATVSAEEAKSGKINVSLVNTGPANAVVSTVEFDPIPTRTRR